jgi:hypothetical protein
MPKLTDRQRYDAVIRHIHNVRAALNAAEESIAANQQRYSPEAVTPGLKFPSPVKVALDKVYDHAVCLAISMQDFESPSSS